MPTHLLIFSWIPWN